MTRGKREIIVCDVLDDYGRKVAQELRGEIVRCADCDHGREHGEEILCMQHVERVPVDGYCYKGVQRHVESV